MSAPDLLLAKSTMTGRAPLSLEQHLLDTEQAARALFEPSRRLHRNWLRFFRLAHGHGAGRRFLLHVRVAALLHDVGKGNSDFYRAVTGGDPIQLVRHEHLSALVLFEPNLRAWLRRSAELDFDVIAASVLSHHLKVHESPQHDFGWCRPRGSASRVAVFLDHPEVRRILDRIGDLLEIGAAPPLGAGSWSANPPWTEWWANGQAAARTFRRAVRDDLARRGLLLATKAGVIAADSVASALVRQGRALDWVNETIHRDALTRHDIDRDILQPRAAQVARSKGRPFQYHRFQDLAAEQDERALLLAGCGAGKTLAAWRWAAAQAAQREFGRVVFLYPTRGTATEGFRDYVGWAPEGEAALVHGASRYELEAMYSNPPDSLDPRHNGATVRAGKDPRLSEEDARLFALGLWSRRYFSATVDQFLGFLEHQYASVCLLPLLADAAVVIDEVHSFDRRMFDDLVAFLRAFDVPVLCMTATLGSERREELQHAGLTAFPRAQHRSELADLEAQEQHARYRIESVDADAGALVPRAASAVRDGMRLLWVVNTVRRCQALAITLEEALGSRPLVYHSRFRLCDRRRQHGAVITAFEPRPATGRTMDAAIAVTTQVCEMSLDLDADILVTELAPASSLVQRFGRANRHRARGDNFRATICVYQPESAAPYGSDEMDRAAEFLASIVGVTCQKALAEALERCATYEPVADGSARFLDSGYFATPGAFRDADERGGPCVLDADLDEARRRIDTKRPWDDLVVNVPEKAHLPERPAWLPRHLHVANASAYDTSLGFLVS
jgi:CRISPR-associated endonuclease/helicase Cas3